MAEDKAAMRERLRRLAVDLRAHLADATAIVEEVEAIISGEPGLTDHVKRVQVFWLKTWSIRYRGATYSWSNTVDTPNLRRLVKLHGPEEMERRIARYLSSLDKFYTENGHQLRHFVKDINKFVTPSNTLDFEDFSAAEPPPDCKHTPPCKDDVAHTRRRNQEQAR